MLATEKKMKQQNWWLNWNLNEIKILPNDISEQNKQKIWSSHSNKQTNKVTEARRREKKKQKGFYGYLIDGICLIHFGIDGPGVTLKQYFLKAHVGKDIKSI